MKQLFIVLLFTSSPFCKADRFDSLDRGFCDMHMHLSLKNYLAKIIDPNSILHNIDSQGNMNTLTKSKIEHFNWDMHQDNLRQMRKGKTSNFKNYYQAGYGKMKEVNYDIVFESLMALEKNTVNTKLKRWLNKNVATHINRAKINSVYKFESSHKEMLSQYHFITNQIEKDTGVNNSQKRGFVIANNADDILKARKNNSTAVILNIEGGNALYDTINCGERSANVLDNGLSPSLKGFDSEILARIDSIKNLKYRIFSIGLTHFTWTRTVGQAKAVDQNKFLSRLTASTLSKIPAQNKNLHNKWGQGIIGQINFGNAISTVDCKCEFEKNASLDIGVKVINKLLTANGRHKKPIYIDVRHMDVQARDEYYNMLDELAAKGIKIPIIMSHGAVSGENKDLAFATGLCPLYDRYDKLKGTARFYKKRVKDKGCFGVTTDAEKNAGRYYPWSVNLYDEEIERIYKSDGMIGLIFYSLPLGADMRRNKSIAHRFALAKEFRKLKIKGDLLRDYEHAESFMKNMFYIAEKSGNNDSTAWDHMCLGSDFDSGEDPIDIAPTVLDVKSFSQKLPDLIDAYCLLNGKDKFGLTSKQIVQKVFHDNMERFVFKYL